ncbi:MAG: hypothetical protein JXB29_01705 [Sedimentisphaerales bacterium]|nr:hypothetical protein [Sedimentisphaerales bacterium]
MKKLSIENILSRITILGVLLLVWFLATPRVISGEMALGGCRPCLEVADNYCGVSEWGKRKKKICPAGFKRTKCFGYSDDFACSDISWSLCNGNAACEPGNNQACF